MQQAVATKKINQKFTRILPAHAQFKCPTPDVVDYPGLLTSNTVVGFIPSTTSILSLLGNLAMNLRVKFFLCAQNEVVNGIVKDKIMKRTVSLIPLLGSGRLYMIILIFINSISSLHILSIFRAS